MQKKYFLLVFFIVVLLVFVGWMFYRRLAFQSLSQNPLSIPITSTSTQATSIFGMKTYTNTEFGFTFQYPEDWKFEINSFYSPFSKFNLQGNSSSTNYNPFYPDFLINIVTPDFVERQFSDLKNIASEISVGGVMGSKYEYKEAEIPHTTIILPYGQYKIILGFGANKSYKDSFNQILSTFKFLK